jgi:S-adenosylmethionine decarboxylase
LNKYSTEGIHYILDIWNPKENILNDFAYLQYILETSLNISKASIVSFQHKIFQPSGLTILYLLEESHASIHTYPEEGYAAIDIFTCGSINPKNGINYLLDMINPEKYDLKEIKRGIALQTNQV